MPGDEAERKGYEVRLPRAGTILVQAVTTATSIDLAVSGAPANASQSFEGNIPGTGGTQSQSATGPGGGAASAPFLGAEGYIGHWIDIDVDAGGGDLGFISGPTSASVTGGNAPALATTGAAGTAGCCKRIPAGTSKPYFVTANDRFLGVISSAGTCTVRISLSSR